MTYKQPRPKERKEKVLSNANDKTYILTFDIEKQGESWSKINRRITDIINHYPAENIKLTEDDGVITLYAKTKKSDRFIVDNFDKDVFYEGRNKMVHRQTYEEYVKERKIGEKLK